MAHPAQALVEKIIEKNDFELFANLSIYLYCFQSIEISVENLTTSLTNLG